MNTCFKCRYCQKHWEGSSLLCYVNPPVVVVVGDSIDPYSRPAVSETDPACRFFETDPARHFSVPQGGV